MLVALLLKDGMSVEVSIEIHWNQKYPTENRAPDEYQTKPKFDSDICVIYIPSVCKYQAARKNKKSRMAKRWIPQTECFFLLPHTQNILFHKYVQLNRR